jgi:predicted enzyme related to lactoylglutathione lyase
MSHAVNWFQIQGPNGHALQQFYKQVFGWKMKAQPGGGDSMMVASEPGGIAGGVGTSQNHQPSVAVYVSVGDIDVLFGKIQRAGGRMAMPKTELPGGMGAIAGFSDPAGNWIGLWMPGKAAAAVKRSSPTKKAGGAKKASGPKKKAAGSGGKKKAAASRVTSSAKKAAKASAKTSSVAKKK